MLEMRNQFDMMSKMMMSMSNTFSAKSTPTNSEQLSSSTEPGTYNPASQSRAGKQNQSGSGSNHTSSLSNQSHDSTQDTSVYKSPDKKKPRSRVDTILDKDSMSEQSTSVEENEEQLVQYGYLTNRVLSETDLEDDLSMIEYQTRLMYVWILRTLSTNHARTIPNPSHITSIYPEDQKHQKPTTFQITMQLLRMLNTIKARI